MTLGVLRGILLAMLLLTLANPVLRVTVTQMRSPLFYLLFDGSESMSISDDYTTEVRDKLYAATEFEPETAREGGPNRMDLVRAAVRRQKNNVLKRLVADHGLQLEVFEFAHRDQGQLRKIASLGGRVEDSECAAIANQLTGEGPVTDIGATLLDAGQQVGAKNLVGVIMFSDYAHNTGVAPLGGADSPATRLNTPIYSVGVGAPQANDLSLTLQIDPKMKRAERAIVQVKLRQVGMAGATARIKLAAQYRKVAGRSENAATEVGVREVALDSPIAVIDFPFTPQEAGRVTFTASVDPHQGEVIAENNTATREVTVIDDFLRLVYVANEPTWEWRFIKEVFHRDKLVGMDGFRTFLSSSDPRVRQSNVLFLPTLTPPRREFFSNDVIFLGDVPAESLGRRFSEMTREFVSKLGGGLVVLSGPRYGPNAFADTPLEDMLPVILDPNAALQANDDFRLRLTPYAARQPFMQLGQGEISDSEAWDNLGPLPWFQPVAAIHPQATVLAEHPTAKCLDGKTPQPLIAIRNYGKGEVVYLAFNETWRLRRRYGERFYRRFWSQLIYRLGMSHALGADKRFSPSLDRQQYRSGDKVVLTVEAYDENYEPLTDEDLPGRALEVQLDSPSGNGGRQTRSLSAPYLRQGVFEARIPVFAAGEHVVRVQDPVTDAFHTRRFDVSGLSSERRRATRNERLQQELARATDGRAYDLTTLDQLVNDLEVAPIPEKLTRNHALWSTPLWFICVVGLMLSEWLCRKFIHLP